MARRDCFGDIRQEGEGYIVFMLGDGFYKTGISTSMMFPKYRTYGDDAALLIL